MITGKHLYRDVKRGTDDPLFKLETAGWTAISLGLTKRLCECRTEILAMTTFNLITCSDWTDSSYIATQ